MKVFLVRLAGFLLFMAAVAEVFFRVAVPAAEMPVGRQDRAAGVMMLDVDGQRDGMHTVGRLARDSFHWHVNDDGFNSAWDYTAPGERDRPEIAVIGNSYVQGLYANVEDHLAGSLQKRLDGRAEVDNFGASGMPFSQAVVVARYAHRRYAPDMLIVLAGHSSLQQSLRAFGFVPYSMQLRETGHGFAEIPPSVFRVNRRNRWLRRSATVRYLFYNANFNMGGGMVQQAAPEDAAGRGPADAARQARFAAAADYILGRLRAENPGIPILVVVDADRRAMYRMGRKPDPLRSSGLLAHACAANGVDFLDLTQAFWEEYRKTGRRLDFEEDYHWNPYGVEIAAAAIRNYMAEAGLIDAEGNLLIGRRP